MTACGLAGGPDLPATVFPHILRSVALLGIDSVYAPHTLRDRAWATLDMYLDRGALAKIMSVHAMEELATLADQIVAGEIRGRVVIQITQE